MVKLVSSSLSGALLAVFLVCSPAIAWAVDDAATENVRGDAAQIDDEAMQVNTEASSSASSSHSSSSISAEQGIKPETTSTSSSSSSASSSASNSAQASQQQPSQTTQAVTKYPVGWSKDAKGIWHYGNKDGSVRTGWLLLGKTWYYLDPANAGAMKTGWYQDTSKRWFYSNGSGAMLANRWIKTGNTWYYVMKNGARQTGWLLLGKTWYYLDPTNAGAMKTGWYQDTSKRWFYSNGSGAMLANRWIKTGNTWYYVMKNGARQTGWLNLGAAKYYLNPAASGAMVVGDFTVLNARYRADASGALIRNTWVDMGGGKLSFAASNGVLHSGAERTSDGKIIIKDSSGKVRTGWINFGGCSFFADPSKGGRLATGWTTSNGKKYYFDSNYAPHKGWLLLNSRWYYFDSDGTMATGWRKVGGSWFWLRSSDGMMLTGSQYVDNAWNFFRSNGAWDATASYMMRRAQGISSNTGWLILVDTSACRTTVFSRSSNSWVVSQTWACSPGAYGTPTKKGYFTIGSRGYYFDSGASRCFYWTQFSGNYLFHSVLYARTATPQYVRDGRLGMNLSHGCVRLDVNCAKWIYDRIPSGTKVYTY